MTDKEISELTRFFNSIVTRKRVVESSGGNEETLSPDEEFVKSNALRMLISKDSGKISDALCNSIVLCTFNKKSVGGKSEKTSAIITRNAKIRAGFNKSSKLEENSGMPIVSAFRKMMSPMKSSMKLVAFDFIRGGHVTINDMLTFKPLGGILITEENSKDINTFIKFSSNFPRTESKQ